MRYFQIMTGLRGCYMPDDSYQICISTRRELKRVLNSEFESAIDAGYIYGLSQKILAQSAAYIWSGKAKNIYGLTIPYRAAYEKAYQNAFTICEITKTEFRAAQWLDGKFHVYQGGAVDCPLRRGIYTRAAYAEFLESLGIDPKNMMEN